MLSKEQVVVFDAPGAANVTFPLCGNFCGTIVSGINDVGIVTGYYNDLNGVVHGFVRSVSGAFETFDAPGAGNQPGAFLGTYPFSIGDDGTIIGAIDTPTFSNLAFIRDPYGKFTLFNVPGAGTGTFQGTGALCINKHGDIAGAYQDSNNVVHGFVRTRNGAVTSFDAPSATFTNPNPPGCLTEGDEVTGTYGDAAGNLNAFLRSSNGAVKAIDPPNHGTAAFGEAINDVGTVVGGYLDTVGHFDGFVRNRDGRFVQFNIHGTGTTAHSINLLGTIAGEFEQNPFVLSRQGVEVDYLIPGMVGAFPQQINIRNVIAGVGYDAANVNHGYIAFPGPASR